MGNDQLRPIQVLPTSATAEQCAEALRADGAVIVDRLVSAEVMDAIRSEVAPWHDQNTQGADDFSGFKTKRTGALIARSETFRDLAAHPLVLETLDLVLGVSSRYQLHLTQVIDIGPDETAQVVHRDQWAFDFFPFPAGYEVECHTMWAMTDFTEANGATRVIPGSNHWEDRLRPDVADTVAAEMAKGSVMLYVGSVYHAGGTNRTAERRCGINVGYTLSWLRQEENQYLAVPPELARTLEPSLAQLVGYARGAYALGYVGDTQDPLDWINGRRSASTFAD
jgi:ectoine hydroxylase-related dioxygenase (phytanoyl-CoA dioxygenase family)